MLFVSSCNNAFDCHAVITHGSAGSRLRGAPSPRTCTICHFKGCKRTGGGKKINLVGMKEGVGWQF